MTVLHNLLMIIMAVIGYLFTVVFVCSLRFKCRNVIEISHFLSLSLSLSLTLTQAINFVKSERGH